MVMFTCIKCGGGLPDTARFCPQCGSGVNGESSEHMVQERLIEISQAMNSTLDLDALLKQISVCACELTCAETGSTMLYDRVKDELYFKVALGEKEGLLRHVTVRDGIAWWVFKNGSPAIANDTASDSRFTGTVDKVTSFDSRSILCVPIIFTVAPVQNVEHDGCTEIIGVIEAINKVPDPHQFTAEDQRILSIFAYQAAVAVRNAKAAGDRRNFFINAIEIFIAAVESTEFVPPGHCMRVARSSIGMAHEFGVEHDDLHDLYYASALHDIGVLDIRCRQSRIVAGVCPESHTILGAEMVRPVNLLSGTGPMIRHHHEAWDGSGYPDGIGGEEIPLGARILAVAEAYEDVGQEKDFIAAEAGRLFDPEVVDAFLEMALLRL